MKKQSIIINERLAKIRIKHHNAKTFLEKTLVFQPRKQNFYFFPVDAAGIGFGGELAKGAQDVLVVILMCPKISHLKKNDMKKHV